MQYETMKTGKILTRYVIPQIIALVCNSIYFIVDGIFIGRRLGTAALAAAGVGVPVVEGMIAFSMLISVGTGVLISRAMGKGDRDTAGTIFNRSVAFTLGLSVTIALVGNLFIAPLSRFLGADDALLADTVTYLRWFISFSPFLVFSFSLSTCARNDGRPGLAMWALTLGSLLNVLLDWVFMYPLNMGIGGAALATGLGPVFSVAMLLPHFLKKNGGRGVLRLGTPSFSWVTVRQILSSGLPAFVAEFSIGFVTLLYNRAIVREGLGEDGLAAYMVIGYFALIALTAFLGAAQGVQPPISYFSAAGMKDNSRRLIRASALFCLGLALGCYGLLAVGGRGFFGIFITGKPALVAMALDKALVYFSCLFPACINILLISYYQSAERVARALILSLSRSTLPVALFLAVLPGLLPNTGLWLAVTCAEVFTLALAGGMALARQR